MSTKSPEASRVRSLLRLVAVNGIVLAALLELSGVALYLAKAKELFYLRRAPPPVAVEGNAVTSAGLPARLHPYFGFVYRPDHEFGPGEMYPGFPAVRRRTNNYGFLSPQDYPTTALKGRPFVVGVFGGSVALSLFLAEERSHVLTGALSRLPAASGREVVFLCFAQPGYKQPQQLLVLSYLLARGQPLDLALCLDGFNEATLSRIENGPDDALALGRRPVDPAMPAPSFVRPLLSLLGAAPALQERSAHVQLSRSRIAALSASAERSRTATGYWASVLTLRIEETRYRRLVAELEEAARREGAGDLPMSVAHSAEPGPLAPAGPVAVWEESAALMHALMRARGGTQATFLQPNVFVPRGRGHREKPLAEPLRSAYAAAADDAWPLLRRSCASLAAKGAPCFDASVLFDRDRVEEVYQDDLCHLTDEGNRRLLAFMGESLASALR